MSLFGVFLCALCCGYPRTWARLVDFVRI